MGPPRPTQPPGPPRQYLSFIDKTIKYEQKYHKINLNTYIKIYLIIEIKDDRIQFDHIRKSPGWMKSIQVYQVLEL
jgi:hypothetical protein